MSQRVEEQQITLYIVKQKPTKKKKKYILVGGIYHIKFLFPYRNKMLNTIHNILKIQNIKKRNEKKKEKLFYLSKKLVTKLRLNLLASF